MEKFKLMVDGRAYRVNVLYPGLENSFSIMEGPNSGTAQSGREIRDIIGTGYSYTLSIEPDLLYPLDFDDLFDVLSQPVESHEVVLPYGQERIEFDMAVSSGSRTWYGQVAGFQRWKNMTIEFRPLVPQREA